MHQPVTACPSHTALLQPVSSGIRTKSSPQSCLYLLPLSGLTVPFLCVWTPGPVVSPLQRWIGTWVVNALFWSLLVLPANMWIWCVKVTHHSFMLSLFQIQFKSFSNVIYLQQQNNLFSFHEIFFFFAKVAYVAIPVKPWCICHLACYPALNSNLTLGPWMLPEKEGFYVSPFFFFTIFQNNKTCLN